MGSFACFHEVGDRAAQDAGQGFPEGGVEILEKMGEESWISGAQDINNFWQGKATAEENKFHVGLVK